MISKGNHVKFARFVLLVVGEEPKTELPGLALLTQQDIEKIVEDKDSQTKHKKVDEGGKGAVC